MSVYVTDCDGPTCNSWVNGNHPEDWLVVTTLGKTYHFEDGECLLMWVASWSEPVISLGDMDDYS